MRAVSLSFSLLGMGLAAAGCGSGTTTLVCQPECPSGLHCTPAGCAIDDPRDSSLASADLALAGCSPGCSGPTPWCKDGLCVPCLKDGDCAAGRRCRGLGQSTACLDGCSDDSGCGGGAMLCCNGECSDTTSDAQHCGDCATACSFSHAAAICASAACTLGACQVGWDDCNRDDADGCETNLALDPASCGACGSKCQLDHALAACSSACYVGACDFGWDDCNGEAGDGCEQSVLADISNCGACGHSCPSVPHAQIGCRNAACILTSCSPGFSDCDGSGGNGCETASATDNNNCGSCGNVCGQAQICVNGGCTCKNCNIPNARTRCANNVCVFDRCLPGFGDCNKDVKDGCEVDLTSNPNNCGACGTVCDVATPVCVDQMCSAARLHWTLVESSACNAWCGGQGPPFQCAGPTFTCDMAHLNGYVWIYSPSQMEPPITIPGNAYGWVSWFCGNNGGCRGPGPNAGNCGGGGPNTVWQCVFD